MGMGLRSVSKIVVAITILFLVYSTLLATNSIGGFPEAMNTGHHWPYLCDKPVGEDGFYMLTVAWNLAHDHKLAYTYGQTTTGIQPLSTFVFAGIAALVQTIHGDRWLFVRLILLFGTLMCVVFSAVMALLARQLASEPNRQAAAELAFCLSLCDFTLFRLFGYGLETGLYLVLVGACVLYSVRAFQREHLGIRTLMLFGALVGLTGLARIDFGLVFAAFLVSMLLLRRMTVLQSLVSGVVALAVVSPWFLFVHHVSYRWMPSSGNAEAGLIHAGDIRSRFMDWVFAMISHSAPWSPWQLSVAPLSVKLVILLSFGALFVIAFSNRDKFRGLFGPSIGIVGAWAVGLLMLSIVYVVFFWAAHFYIRYAAPFAAVSIPMVAIVLAYSRSSAKFRLVVPVFAALCFTVWAAGSLHNGKVGNTLAVSAGFLQRNFSGVPVGTFQSGIAGFFNPNVTNLDGKVNFDALYAVERGQLGQYVDAREIQVLVDVPNYFTNSFRSDYLASSWKPCPNLANTSISNGAWGATPNQRFVCYVRRGRGQ